jgi:hypothetical protein
MAKRAAGIPGLQTSKKMGVRSLAEKMENARHVFDPAPPTRRKPGAFGEEAGRKEEPAVPGTASPGGKGAAIARMDAVRDKVLREDEKGPPARRRRNREEGH